MLSSYEVRQHLQVPSSSCKVVPIEMLLQWRLCWLYMRICGEALWETLVRTHPQLLRIVAKHGFNMRWYKVASLASMDALCAHSLGCYILACRSDQIGWELVSC